MVLYYSDKIPFYIDIIYCILFWENSILLYCEEKLCCEKSIPLWQNYSILMQLYSIQFLIKLILDYSEKKYSILTKLF